jgi:hypothetical protein
VEDKALSGAVILSIDAKLRFLIHIQEIHPLATTRYPYIGKASLKNGGFSETMCQELGKRVSRP